MEMTITVTGDYSAAVEKLEEVTILADASGGPLTITLPDVVPVVTYGQFRSLAIYTVKKIDATANAVTVTTSAGQTIDGGPTAVISMPNLSLSLANNALNWFVT